MRRVVTDVELRRVDLGDGDWVDLKRRLTVADREYINNAVSEASKIGAREGDDGEVTVTGVNWASAFGATLRRSIVAWGGPGFCVHDHEDGSPHSDDGGSNGCGPLPLTSAHIAALDDGTANRLAAIINAGDPRPRKEEGAHP